MAEAFWDDQACKNHTCQFSTCELIEEQQHVEVPVPSTADDGLLVKIHAAGVCHSDVGLLNTEPRPPTFNEKYTLGHEGCGEIVEVGSKVSGFNVGEMVAILAVPGCGESSCGECSRGYPQICQTGEHYGIGNDGSYTSYIAINKRAAAKLPSGVTAEQGAVATDACLTAYHAVVGTGNVQKGETVVILGTGGLGFNALQIALARGARVIVMDRRQEVLDEAIKFGVAKEDVVPTNTSLQEFVASKQLVVDTVVDFVGVPDTCTAAVNAVRFGGKYVLVGLLAPEITLPTILVVRKHLQILCSYGGTMDDLKACLDLISKGQLKPQVEKGDLDKFADVLDDLHHGKIRSRIALVPRL